MTATTSRHRPHGAREWLTERAALLVLIPLGVWLAFSGVSLVGASYEDALAWASSGLNAILLGITVVLFCLFGALAWKVILEDYVHGTARAVAMAANYAFFAILAVAALFFIVTIALGSAPTGA